MYKDTYLRSLTKSVSWRLSGFVVTTVIVFIVSHQFALALTVGIAEAISKVFLFFAHERVWEKIRIGRRSYNPVVIWLTGLPGAGKTTLGEALLVRLRDAGFKVEHLDGNHIRTLFAPTGYSREARLDHNKRVGHLASHLEQAGVIVIVSLISPYKEGREFVRSLCKNFVEVYVSTPLQICESRDPKGLYAGARQGIIRNFTGVSDPYEIPERPEMNIDTNQVSVEAAVAQIDKYLSKIWFKK